MGSWPFPRVFAHRGGGTVAPENTLAAMRAGLAAGFRAVEFDVMLAQDQIPVLMHDPVFGRTVAGSGSVSDTPSRDLVLRDAGSWFSPAFIGEKIPLYTEIASFCETHGIFMNVEIKPAPGFAQATGTVVGVVTEGLRDAGVLRVAPLFSSFDSNALRAFSAAAPSFPRAHLFDRVDDDALGVAEELGCQAIHCNQKNLDVETARRIRDRGFGLFCYTVNSVERARELLDWGVDAFCTDRIDLIDPAMA